MNRRTSAVAGLAVAVVCCLSATAYANPTITAGDWTINPAAGQSVDVITALPIEVQISGGDLIFEVVLFMTSGPDGFTAFSGPLFEAIDLIGVGTIFNPNNIGQFDIVAFPDLHTFSATQTVSGSIAASGTLAFLTFDATGVAPGVYTLHLTNLTFGIPTDTQPFLSPILVNGTVTVIPEPGSIVLALFAAGGLCAVAIRRRRKVA